MTVMILAIAANILGLAGCFLGARVFRLEQDLWEVTWRLNLVLHHLREDPASKEALEELFRKAHGDNPPTR